MADTAAPALVYSQLRYANTSFWRTPVAAFFTLAMPLVFLLLISAIAGNQTIDSRGGVRIAQFYTPALMAFGIVMATFVTPAIAVALSRDQGILKRLRGTPLPLWAYLAGRMGSGVWTALIAVGTMLLVAVLFLDVQIIPRMLPAAVVTFVVGVLTFTALGLAVSSIVTSPQTIQAATSGVTVLLSFLSGVFLPTDQMPTWLTRIADIFPLKHFVEAMVTTFNPFSTGSGFEFGHLAVMAAWAVAGVAVALRFFSVEVPAKRARANRARSTATAPVASARPAVKAGRPGAASLLWGQARYANTAEWRDIGSVVFGMALPVFLVLLLPLVFGNAVLPDEGVPFAQALAPAMVVYGAGVFAYVDLPEKVALARERGVVKRLRGTPLPGWAYIGGRMVAALWLTLFIALLTVGAALVAHDVQVNGRMVLPALATLVVGVACFTALGLAIVALAPNAKTVPAVALATLLPLSFVSGIFAFGPLPPAMERVGQFFPLRHFRDAMVAAFTPGPTGGMIAPDNLAVMAAWGVVAAVVAVRGLRWSAAAAGG